MDPGPPSVLTAQVGRLVTGMGNGLITSSVPVWHAELSQVKSRGMLITTEVSINVVRVLALSKRPFLRPLTRTVAQGGVMVAYWVDYGMSYVTSGAQWRFPISVQIFFALSTIALIAVLPESPRWLIYHDLHSEAKEIFSRLHGFDQPETVEHEMTKILVAVQEEKTAAQSSGYVLTSVAPAQLVWSCFGPWL